MLERSLQKKVTSWLKKNKIYYIDLSLTGAWSGKGKPDLVVCVNGKFVAFELKVGNNDMQPDQIIHKRRIERSGGLHFKPYSFEEFLDIMQSIK